MMKNMTQKIGTFVLVILLCSIFSVTTFAAQPEEVTMGDLEQELLVYLEEAHPEIKLGTAAYIDYLMGVLVESADEKLAQHPDYENIRTYAGAYICEGQWYQIVATENFDTFIPSASFYNRTLATWSEASAAEMTAELPEQEDMRNKMIAYAMPFCLDEVVALAEEYAAKQDEDFRGYYLNGTKWSSYAEVFSPKNDPMKRTVYYLIPFLQGRHCPVCSEKVIPFVGGWF